MKKWFDYQMQNIVGDRDWSSSYQPITNIANEFSDDFHTIKQTYEQWAEQSHPNLACSQELVGSDAYALYIQNTYDDPEIQKNIIEWCQDPKYRRLLDNPSVDRIDLVRFFPEITVKLCKKLQVTQDYCMVLCQIQRPGYISPLHIDSRKTIKFTPGQKIKPTAVPDHSRWIIFMEDWQPGQVFEMGHEYVKWNKGDVFYWSTKDVPHALANMGYWDRFLILIYGRHIDQQ